MTLDRAIDILKEEYQKALGLHWVWSPIAFAMYQSWKRVDEAEQKERKDAEDNE